MHLVRPHVARQPVDRRHPRLGHQQPIAGVLVEDLPPLPIDLVYAVLVPHRRGRPERIESAEHRARRGPIRQVAVLDQTVGHVDAEPVDAAIEPEPQHAGELVADHGVVPVQVGLGDVEEMQVPLTVRHPLPGRAAEDALPRVRRLGAVRPAAVPEHVPLALRAARRGGQGGLEPRVLAGGVVRHQVDDELEAQLVGLADQLVGIAEITEEGVDGAVVGDVVARVLLR
jgi:hypothetical protein